MVATLFKELPAFFLTLQTRTSPNGSVSMMTALRRLLFSVPRGI